MDVSSVNMTSRLSGAKLTSYMEAGNVNANTHAGRFLLVLLPPPPTSMEGSNVLHTSPITRDTDGKSTGRPLILKNCISRALPGLGDVGEWEMRPVICHFPMLLFLLSLLLSSFTS